MMPKISVKLKRYLTFFFCHNFDMFSYIALDVHRNAEKFLRANERKTLITGPRVIVIIVWWTSVGSAPCAFPFTASFSRFALLASNVFWGVLRLATVFKILCFH